MTRPLILAAALLVATAGYSEEFQNVLEFGQCAVGDHVDMFTDEVTSFLYCESEDDSSTFVGFRCSADIRSVSISVGTNPDWLASVRFRIGKAETLEGTWRAGEGTAYVELDSAEPDDHTRNNFLWVIGMFEDAVHDGDAIALEIDGVRSRIEFDRRARHALSEYRERCAA